MQGWAAGARRLWRISFETSDGGSVTTLRLGPPDAFEPFAVRKIKSDIGYWVTTKPSDSAAGAP